MCGINGVIRFDNQIVEESLLLTMNEAIQHRGPDAMGVWVKDAVGLGHVRLSIIDLSDAGKQPMIDEENGLVLVFNGEIYNYQKLKEQLDYPFKTATDSEVIFAAYLAWGEKMWSHFEGMFAIALYDLNNKKILLGRDRLGIKPIYMFQNKEVLVFSSEIRGVLASRYVAPVLDRKKLPMYFSMGTIAGSHTLLQGVEMLPPGSQLKISDNGQELTTFWRMPQKLSSQMISYEEAKLQVKEKFYEAVSKRLVSDVAFGAFLSGGIDSTAITGVMSTLISGPLHSFNISFDEGVFSEAKYAKQVAEHFGTVHHEIKLSPTVFLDEIDSILAAYDHPGSDGANTFIVSKATKNAGITMALSGLGGDELFGGYPVFSQLEFYYKKLSAIPYPIRKLASMMPYFQKTVRNKKMAYLLGLKKIELHDVYATFRSICPPQDVGNLTGTFFNYADVAAYFSDTLNQMISSVSRAEMERYMQPVLLRDADQMSMAHGLEVRVPFLDHDLLEFVLSLPDDYKKRGGGSKPLIVAALGNHILPNHIVNRPKMGFVLPWENWMRKELKGLVEEAMDYGQFSGIIEKQKWQNAYHAFCEGKQSYNWNVFWALVTLTNWMKANKVS